MLPISPRLASTSLLILACAACGSDPQGTGDDTETGTPPGTSTTGDENPTTGDATTEASTTGAPEWQPGPARGGLEIDWVEANQGIGVAIGRDGTGVGGGDRSSYLLRDRVMLVRAFWKQPPADWAPRKIDGRLIVSYQDGEELTLSSKTMVEDEAFIGNLNRSFYWGLKPEQVLPGMRYRVELWEAEPGAEDLPEPEAPPSLPADGSDAFVGVEASDQVLKITIVPFNYNADGCNTEPDTSEERMQLFYDYMYMMNPVDTLEITMHEPIDWTEPLTDFNELNAFMSGELREAENAEPERYYYGLVDVCSGGLGGAGGKAFGIPQGGKMEDAWQRVSSGLSIDDAEWSAETFVHEVGHSQGRFHVFCNGEEGGPDFSYPHPNGEIGEWGFGVINFKLYHPTVHRDYMTYCHPVWASTWGWNKVYPIIKTLSSWDDAGAPAPGPGTTGALLVGSVYPDGKETWITVTGAVRPEELSAVHGVEFEVDGETVHQPAAWLPQPDGDVVNVVTPLPARWDAVTRMTRVAGPQRFAVDPARVRQGHRLRASAR
jgi:hypothetical protein